MRKQKTAIGACGNLGVQTVLYLENRSQNQEMLGFGGFSVGLRVGAHLIMAASRA